MSNSGNNSTLCELSLDVQIIGKMFLTRNNKDLYIMFQPRNKLVQFGRQVEGVAVCFQEALNANEVDVVLKVLCNRVISKLYRWSSNHKMRELAKGWVVKRNKLKQRTVSVTRILM